MAAQYNRKDHLYTKAKEEGYHSRAAYKLKELQDRFSLIKRSSAVFDLGAWPGGWSQVALEYLGPNGRLVGIDLQRLDDAPDDERALFIVGDARDEENIAAACEFVGSKFDLLLSDMSPKLSGIREVDQLQSVSCAELALYIAEKTLKPGGHLVIKLFKGSEADGFVKSVRPIFNKVSRVELKSTRSTSNEFYLVANEKRT